MSWLSSLAPVIGTGLGALLAAPTGGMSMGMGALIGGMAGSGVSSAVGATEALDAQKSANQANIDMTNATNATQIELANTAHQREVADLKAAGLNPILSSKYGGSATPGLTSPTMTSLAPIVQSSAQQARETFFTNANLASDIALKQAQVVATSAKAQNDLADLHRKAMENQVISDKLPYDRARVKYEGMAWKYNSWLNQISNTFRALNPFGDLMNSGKR